MQHLLHLHQCMHAGNIYATLGNAAYARVSNVPGHAKATSQTDGIHDIETDVAQAIAIQYGGTAIAK